ncbi:MAG: DMT family transporter [Hyphomicrobiales bacterium]|nr:DMT family transporter [Hyphomicrobiales bacterium]
MHEPDQAGTARLLLLLLTLIWGMSWPMMKIALDEIGVIALRAAGFTISAFSLFALILLRGRTAAIPRGPLWGHILVAGAFNVVGFGLFSSMAQVSGSTARVVIVNYSMPVWGSLFAWIVLRERLDRRATAGLLLCVGGLSTLVYQVASAQSALALLLALGCSLSWAAGTIYMKWARLQGDLLAITAWQIAMGALVFLAILPFVAVPPIDQVSARAWLGVLYNGLFATGFAYILWFAIIERLPTATASLGVLATPIVGIGSSMLILGERPSWLDSVGFALILAAAACVLVRPRIPALSR